MIFIFGLGNPGEQYKNTLHNLGFQVLDKLAAEYKTGFRKRICKAKIACFDLPCYKGEDCKSSDVEKDNFWMKIGLKNRIKRRDETNKIQLIKPYTYMNLSGVSIGCIRNKYQFQNKDLLVICDDLSLGKGYIKIKSEGGSGGHKGIASVIAALGSDNFPRLRIGIGPLDSYQAAEEYVLKELSQREIEDYNDIVEKVTKIVDFYIRDGIDKAMSFYNRKKII
ncbi:MAG: aminoacyl-tRNA hydrolase [Candidatus Saelkia tenebricola]|nr:aminoacyl-tRNA hydrolase [Candidatus Saelkia tenebricola]